MAAYIDAQDDGDPGIDEWMKRRQQDVDNGPADYARGVDAFGAAIQSGQDVSAPTPDAVRAIGADTRAQDAAATAAAQAVRRGDKAVLSDKDIAGIIFNETRSFSGPDIDLARQHLAHALMNADETWGPKRATYAKSAPTVASPPKTEASAYQSAVNAVASARAQRAKGSDPTNGALNFYFPTTPTMDPFQKRPIKTHVRVHNGFVTGDVPSPTAYVNTY